MYLVRIFFWMIMASVSLHAQRASSSELKALKNQVLQALDSKNISEADSLAYLMMDKVQKSDFASDTAWVNAYSLLGTVEHYKARYRVSVSFYEKALAFPLVNNTPALKQQILNNIGSSQTYLGKLPDALNAFRESMKISEDMNDQESIVDLWVNMADLEFELGNYNEAIALTHKAMKGIEASAHNSSCHLNLGKYYTVNNQLDKGYYHTQIALREFTKLDDTYYIVASLVNMAFIEQRQNNFQASSEYMQKAMDMAQANKFDRFIVPALIHQSQNVILSGRNLAKAKEYALEAIRLARISGRRGHMEDATLELARYYAASGDIKAFSTTMDEYNTIKKETVKLNANATAEEFKAIYELERLSDEIGVLRQNIRLKNQQLLFTIISLLMLTLTGSIIYAQYRRLQQNMKTMFRMNVNLAYSRPGDTAIPETTTADDSNIELSDVELFKMILRKIEAKELYKDPNLGIHELARHMKRTRITVSKAINIAGRTNFASLINSFKVNEARRILHEENPEMSMSDIATAAGFSSRTSFNRHFKELTGFTPSQYLQMRNSEVENEEEDTAGDALQES
jgi:AraC-like DNA-binding protein